MNSKKTTVTLNGEQRLAAYCEENVVVAAGAGSGKTSVIAARFAFLITQKGYRVDQILTLTFTRKAAAEMYQRIYTTLSDIALKDQGIQGQRAKEAIRDFIHARIQTLDSYGVSIVKQAASRYGLRPDFTTDEERCYALAREESLPFLIGRRNHPAIERLYPQKGPEGIAGDIFASAVFKFSYIDAPPDFTEDVKKQFDIICAEWNALTGNITEALKELGDVLAGDGGDKLLPDAAPLVAKCTSGNVSFPAEREIRAYFDSLLPLNDTECIAMAESHPVRAAIWKILQYLGEITSINLRKGKRSNNPAKEIVKKIRDPLFGAFSSLAVFCMQSGFILSVMSLLGDLQKQYLDKKRAEGVLTFTDAARLARTILRDHPDIRKGEKDSFRAIMIDEFQDNNSLQKELLFLLAEKPRRMDKGIPSPQELTPGKLFFVGDEKQSIYRFRGADVSVFCSLKEELGGRELALRINYRSSPGLIGAFNAVFGGSGFDPAGAKPLAEYASVFVPMTVPGEDLPQEGSLTETYSDDRLPLPPYEAAYSSLEAGRTEDGASKSGGHGSGLTVCILNKSDTAENDEDGTIPEGVDRGDQLSSIENEARFTAGRIQQLLVEKNESGEAKYRPDDIAILFRSHSPQHLFEKHLRLFNIPYASEDISEFFSGGPVNDMMSILRLAAYPLDTDAYAVMLRSPFAGLSLRGLAICLAPFNAGAASAESSGDVSERQVPTPFSEDILPRLPKGDEAGFIRGRDLYRRICEKASKETVSTLVSELWYTEGYRYETEWNPRTQVYRGLYDYLFHLAAKAEADELGLAAFTDSIQALRESGERLRDIDIPLERSGAVRLMTVHKSKGLEFPVVFLCCCGSHGRSGGDSADVYETGSAGVSFNPPMPPECSGIPGVRRNFFYERSSAEEHRKKTAELRRLLYVAMTRAERELYLTGSLTLGETEGEGDDDFSLRLKAFAETKREDAAGRIAGDTILDDDTFLGLVLPSLADHIPPEGLEAQPSFFRLEAIPVYTDDQIQEQAAPGTMFPNNRRGLSRFLEKAAPFYDKAETLSTPEIKNRRHTPTSYREIAEASSTDISFTVDTDRSGEDAGDVFIKVDHILKRYADRAKKPDAASDVEGFFTPADFGTIAHACAEALLNNETPRIPPDIGGRLTPREAEGLLSGGTELAKHFMASPLGRATQNAALRKSEYRFRSLYGVTEGATGSAAQTFINGTIDLLFEDDESVWVVDFKTDSREHPAEHIPQMAFYYRAAMDLLGRTQGKECRLFLYYLRTGHAVEMTGAAKKFRIEAII
jgi:ATP-dependent helicase/nuclease subunit A